ncbi:heme ABC transporter permease [Anaplasma marginale]|uniref:Heme exporter protein C n=2 Tax=Anaplasma TaxID=768 RepID=D1ASW8_ANACI|nr:putative ABC-type transport system protein [Anaplasma centrale str. Israel]KAA8472249.1 heme ABC transporter permease [Anaplasma marginale]KAA8474293.1 heme ABC transporter permease [Anaplasma marginale]KAB0450564.1 heme ABC transporter permease [Anaplasma marginale]KAB0451812.1 heme ABC transporter permease [Anaplasma marginale]
MLSSGDGVGSFWCGSVKGLVRYSWAALPCLVCICAVSMAVGLYCALYASPPDYRQGEVVRIMYLHVPSAWISLGTYAAVAVLSFVALIKKNAGFLLSRAMAPVGGCFTMVCLVTGSVWGKYTWGAWWVWDARLTSMLLLLFLYLGYSCLWNAFEDQARASRAAALFAVFSAINVPIVKFSVDIWSTLHQPASVLRKGGVAIDSSMLVPLFAMFTALASLFGVFTLLRISTLVRARKCRARLARIYSQEAL